MQTERTTDRRAYGTGSIFVKGGSYFGQWRVDGRKVKRKLGPVRRPTTSEGLTKAQAEARLRKLMADVKRAQPDSRITFAQAADLYLEYLQNVMKRKRSTLEDYRSMTRTHLVPHFGSTPVDRIRPEDIATYLAAKARDGLAANTTRNHVNFVSSVFRFAVKRGLVASNPVAAVDRPRSPQANPVSRIARIPQV